MRTEIFFLIFCRPVSLQTDDMACCSQGIFFKQVGHCNFLNFSCNYMFALSVDSTAIHYCT